MMKVIGILNGRAIVELDAADVATIRDAVRLVERPTFFERRILHGLERLEAVPLTAEPPEPFQPIAQLALDGG